MPTFQTCHRHFQQWVRGGYGGYFLGQFASVRPCPHDPQNSIRRVPAHSPRCGAIISIPWRWAQSRSKRSLSSALSPISRFGDSTDVCLFASGHLSPAVDTFKHVGSTLVVCHQRVTICARLVRVLLWKGAI
jgi:hypothetical protein